MNLYRGKAAVAYLRKHGKLEQAAKTLHRDVDDLIVALEADSFLAVTEDGHVLAGGCHA
jgi:hypothetical protein